MKARQKVIVWAWILAIAAICAGPPTYYSNDLDTMRLDVPKLLIRFLVATLVAAGLFAAWPFPVTRAQVALIIYRARVILLALVAVTVAVASALLAFYHKR